MQGRQPRLEGRGAGLVGQFREVVEGALIEFDGAVGMSGRVPIPGVVRDAGDGAVATVVEAGGGRQGYSTRTTASDYPRRGEGMGRRTCACCFGLELLCVYLFGLRLACTKVLEFVAQFDGTMNRQDRDSG